MTCLGIHVFRPKFDQSIENICRYFIGQLINEYDLFPTANVKKFSVRVFKPGGHVFELCYRSIIYSPVREFHDSHVKFSTTSTIISITIINYAVVLRCSRDFYKQAGNGPCWHPAQVSKRAERLKYSRDLHSIHKLWTFLTIIQCQKISEGVPLRLENSFLKKTESIRKTPISNKIFLKNCIVPKNPKSLTTR